MSHETSTEFKLINVNELVPYVNNARTHSAEQINKIRASLREFGFVNPVIIDREKNVIAGHGRLTAAKAEGFDEVPCVFIDDMTEAQKKGCKILFGVNRGDLSPRFCCFSAIVGGFSAFNVFLDQCLNLEPLSALQPCFQGKHILT